MEQTFNTNLIILVGIAGYFFGSIPFGIVWAKVFNLGDLRQVGSGNVGATNVLRTGNKVAAFLTLLGDSSKAILITFLVKYYVNPDLANVAAVCAVLGHNFPVWLKFQGGKGVASSIGLWLALYPPAGLVGVGTWIGMVAITRLSSLAALTAFLIIPIYLIIFEFGQSNLIGTAIILAILGFIRHKSNIKNLIQGKEDKVGSKKG